MLTLKHPVPAEDSAPSSSPSPWNDWRAHHRLDLADPALRELLERPELVGLSQEDLRGLTPSQRNERIAGEHFARVASAAGQLASRLLMKAQWGYGSPEWFDHRHHVLDPESQWNDFWTMSADNVVEVLPLGGRLLDLCAGDGFYDFHYYRHRASEVVCVDLNEEAHRYYLRLHSAPNIKYHLMDLFQFPAAPASFDTVVIRGAIEHFPRERQHAIFRLAHDALKPGGWFCGDTPANPHGAQKMLDSHECEWEDEAQMRAELSTVFSHVETRTLQSRERVTLFWRCRKPG